MRYAGMPLGMWALLAGSFREHLTSVYGYDPETAKAVTRKAKPKYRAIIGHLPEFEKADRFKMNIVNCALLSAFLLNLPKRPTAEKTTEYEDFRLIDTADGTFYGEKRGLMAWPRRLYAADRKEVKNKNAFPYRVMGKLFLPARG